MILIESLKARQVDGMLATVGHFPKDAVEFGEAGNIPRGCDYTTETVVADRFKDITGRTFEIGMTKEVRDVLGLPLECFRNLMAENEDLLKEGAALVREDHGHRAHIKNLRRHLNDFEQMSRWQRFCFLFRTGGRVW